MRTSKVMGALVVLFALIQGGSALGQDEGGDGGNADGGAADTATTASSAEAPPDASSEAVVCLPSGKTKAGAACAAPGTGDDATPPDPFAEGAAESYDGAPSSSGPVYAVGGIR